MNRNTEIAILLFSRSAGRESNSKRWTQDQNVNAHISKQLLSNTLENLKNAPFPVVLVDESLQFGNTFAERLANGFKHVFEKGFLQVIAVGNDCLDLNLDWKTIAAQLQMGKTILGPDRRGGVYLIGISNESDIEEKFSRISWKSNKVYDQLTKQFNNCYLLDSKQDINTFEDIIKTKSLFQQIKRFLVNQFIEVIQNPIISITPNALLQLRAPPSLTIV